MIKKISLPKIKTIDVQASEWYDKPNGNIYFSAWCYINYGMNDMLLIAVPYSYGYGNQAAFESLELLEELKIIKDRKHHDNGAREGLGEYCRRKKIILRTSAKDQLKRHLLSREYCENHNSLTLENYKIA